MLAPLTTNPTAAAALTVQDRTRLRHAVRQAIWCERLEKGTVISGWVGCLN